MVVEADSPCQADKVIEAEISLSDRSSSVADKVLCQEFMQSKVLRKSEFKVRLKLDLKLVSIIRLICSYLYCGKNIVLELMLKLRKLKDCKYI